jgi:hypothetical protein
MATAKRLEEIEEDALALPEGDRVALAHSLLASFVEEPDISDAWMEEIRRRRAEIERGEVALLDEDEMFARIEARRRR